MQVGLVTTLNTNIGDDFVREGVCLILREVLKGHKIEFVPINKHQPFTVYPNWHPLYSVPALVRLLPRGKNMVQRWSSRFLYRVGYTRFDFCNVIVQCGTPVVWPGCSQCEWAEPLWYQAIIRLSRKGMPVLNLGAGSCYPWEKEPRQVENENDVFYLKKILECCRLTTVRDRVAQQLFKNLGQFCPLIPCPAFLVGKSVVNNGSEGDFIVINYMEKGGHYDWEQHIDTVAWRNILRSVIEVLRKQHQVLFLCHDEKEYRLAFQLNSTIPRFLPKNAQEYFTVISRAKVGLCNRLHASIILAGMGIPSLAVGVDSRLLMVDAVGLPCLYVKETTAERIEEILQQLLVNRERERERLFALREQTWDRYVEVIRKALS